VEFVLKRLVDVITLLAQIADLIGVIVVDPNLIQLWDFIIISVTSIINQKKYQENEGYWFF
jgi:hypothetical protein